MKHFGFVLALSLMLTPAIAQNQADMQLPQLHKIMQVTLSPSYSCRPAADFRNGYQKTALFLSGYSKKRNNPELLFNGACNSADGFDVRGGGDSLDVITDYGNIPLAELAAMQVFSPQMRTDSLASFASSATAKVGHTYGVLINRSDVRGFFYFRVLTHEPNRKVELEYAVMDYQVSRPEAQSQGFGWDKKPVR